MRIGFCGSHGTGKTSLANELMTRDFFKEFTYVPSSSRRLSNRLSINQSAGPLDQLTITVARVADEDKASAYGKRSILADRTPLDSIAYTKYQNDEVWNGEADYVLEASEGFVRRWMRDYDTVVYFPVYEWDIEDDGVRKTDRAYQKQISQNCLMYLNKFDIRPYVVRNVPVDKRADYMIDWLKRRM